jgi:hypothetical protein
MRRASLSKYRRRIRDLDFMKWVRRQPCAAREFDVACDGHVEADHAGRRGYGQKADDRTCIPLCAKHHEMRGSFHGAFKDWDQARMRAWLERAVSDTQAAYAAWQASKEN